MKAITQITLLNTLRLNILDPEPLTDQLDLNLDSSNTNGDFSPMILGFEEQLNFKIEKLLVPAPCSTLFQRTDTLFG